MPKREFKGDPIDAAAQYIGEADYWDGGETVGGTTEDDMGDEETTGVPEGIDDGSGAESDDEPRETEREVAAILTGIGDRLEALENDVAALQKDDGGASVTAVDRDTLFKIVSGEELTDDERRGVFEQVME